MLSVTDNFKAAVNAAARNLDVVVKLIGKNDTDYTNARIYSSKDALLSLKIVDGQTTGGFSLGGTICPSLTAELHKTAVVSIGDKVKAELIVYNGGGNLTMASEFTVDDIKRKADGTLSVTALGNMMKLAKNYISSLTYPTTQLAVLEEIAAQSGYALHPLITNELINNPEIQSAPVKGKAEDGTTLYYTRREMLGYAAAINGGAAYISQYGYIGLARHNDTGETFTHEQVFKETITEPFEITSVKWNSAGLSYSLGDDYDENTIEFYNPLVYNAREQIAHNLETDLIGFSYDGATIKKQGCGYFEVGDVVHYTDIGGKTHDLLILGIVYEFVDGYFTETLHSLTNTATQREYAGNEVVSNQIGGGQAKSATYTTKQIFSTEDTELSDIVSTPLNLDFTVDNADSDVIVTVNQYISVSSGGTVQSAYVVDGEELFTAWEDVTAGRHVLTHVVPVSALAGQHNLIIRQLSADARGLTEAGGLRGAASGHISGITIELPPNDNLIIKVSIPENGYELNLNSYGSSYAGTTGMIYWGDGSTQSDYNYTSPASHVYEGAGDYKIVITSTTVNMPSALVNSSDQAVVTEIAFPDKTTVVGGVVNGYTALRNISFGAGTKKIDGTCGYCTSLSGTLKLPEKLEELAIRSFERCSALTKVIADCPSLQLVEGFIFDSCTSLTDVEWNAPVLGNLQFSDCTNLQNVSLGKGITVIPNQCFKNCASLNNVVIPEGVTTIIFNAFQGCSSLDSVQLPSTLQEIGSVAFGGTALKSVSLPDGCTYYSNSFPSDCVVSGGVLIS